MRLLVSCCNHNGTLYLVDGDDVQIVFPSACTGLSRRGDGFYVAHPTGVMLFDANLVRQKGRDSPAMADIHDVKEDSAGNVLVVEAARNRVGCWSPDWQMVSAWAPTAHEHDACHLNSIVFHDGALLVSMFDMKGRGPPWARRLHGVIAKVEQSGTVPFTPIWRHIQHPHSLVVADGDLWWCDSRRCRVMRNGVEVARLPAYTRGLAVTKDWVIVGQSQSFNHPASFKRPGTCSIWYYPRKAGDLGEPIVVELPSTEVYDIIAIGGYD